jgi:uncharacterized protein (TIGR02466 family)
LYITETKSYTENGGGNHKLIHYYDPVDGLNLLDCEGFGVFHDWIKACSLEYINKVLDNECEDVIVTECWLNVCKRGGLQPPHNHCNSIVSGTYFVNFVPGKHAPLLFVNKPNEVHPYLRVGTGFKKFAHVEHTEGTLLLWQSHISHGYEENMEDNRMTISFNVMPTTIKSDGANYGFKISRI